MGGMQRLVLLAFALVAGVSASAQSLDKPTRLSVFISPGAGWNRGSGIVADGGYGVSLERRFSRVWSAEISVAAEQHETRPYLFDPTVFKLDTHPVDLIVRYSFKDLHTTWRPFVGAGVRYVAAPDAPPGREYDDELSPEVAGGAEFNFGEAWSAQFELKLLARNETSVFDEPVKASVAIGWRF